MGSITGIRMSMTTTWGLSFFEFGDGLFPVLGQNHLVPFLHELILVKAQQAESSLISKVLFP